MALMLTAVNEGRITIEELIEKMHTNPKRIFNLPDQEDTYIEVDLDEEWRIPGTPAEGSETGPYTRCGWTPFAGRLVKGRVKRVVLRGEIAMLDGKVYTKPGTGRDVAVTRGKTVHYPSTVLPMAAPFLSIRNPLHRPSQVHQSTLPIVHLRVVSFVVGSPEQPSFAQKFAT